MVRTVNVLTGVITVVASGGSNPGNDALGHGGPAIGDSLYGPLAVALDAASNVYIADTSNDRVRLGRRWE